MTGIRIAQALYDIRQRMNDTPGIENMRTLISTHLTKVLMLYGRLHTDYNPRYLPVTVNSILVLISELEMIERKYYGFDDIMKENIERREKFSNVFLVPDELASNPSTKGLRIAMCALASPLISSYCQEDKKFLEALDDQVSFKTRHTLFLRTRRNCEMLRECCPPECLTELDSLHAYCSRKIEEMEAGSSSK